MASRFALYAAPPADGPLHKFAAEWLGWDPETGEGLPIKPAAGLNAERIAALTAEPRRYGFHGTLKPPFHLAEGCDEGQLIVALERFVAARKPIRLRLKLDVLGSFLALRPDAPCPEIDALAADCVRDFDRFRAPPSESELTRRRAAGLTERQEQYLAAWGYPYVMEEFRLHFTLTGRIEDAAEREKLFRHLQAQTAPLIRDPFMVDEICLFVQPASDAPFRIAGRYRFGG
ncbi:DUF1045 domain-containing protein [uncultured Ferrovibrio sp.]|jgi:putative phosphonate metabolism protein|uniref:DUF1045 domain-containing protein n=1 Tax=uncultured Ferrovibrio sp. TaxID=1576913 RepID=UPI0026175C77|nr:DUF1045 domain-containing protein [uncultured Ferrovibrio sp.]